MEEKIKNAMEFYVLATTLKNKIRSGWDEKHWNVSKERLESVAEHIYGTLILAIAVHSEFDHDIDLNKVLKMLAIHELGEVVIGDITPFDNVTEKEKEVIEHEGVMKVLGNLSSKDELYNLMLEFDERKTNEAIFAYYCDKIEADLQAKIYQDSGFQNSLDNQENNVVFQNEKARKMVEDGATTAFDIWYLWDKDKFQDDEVFKNILEYANENELVSIQKQNSLSREDFISLFCFVLRFNGFLAFRYDILRDLIIKQKEKGKFKNLLENINSECDLAEIVLELKIKNILSIHYLYPNFINLNEKKSKYFSNTLKKNADYVDEMAEFYKEYDAYRLSIINKKHLQQQKEEIISEDQKNVECDRSEELTLERRKIKYQMYKGLGEELKRVRIKE